MYQGIQVVLWRRTDANMHDEVWDVISKLHYAFLIFFDMDFEEFVRLIKIYLFPLISELVQFGCHILPLFGFLHTGIFFNAIEIILLVNLDRIRLWLYLMLPYFCVPNNTFLVCHPLNYLIYALKFVKHRQRFDNRENCYIQDCKGCRGI